MTPETLEMFIIWNDAQLEWKKLREQSEAIADKMEIAQAGMREATRLISELLWEIGPAPSGVKIGDDYIVATEFDGNVCISSVQFKTPEEILDVQ